jgi:alpha-beta hydrolase superfamily lysophospholipase
MDENTSSFKSGYKEERIESTDGVKIFVRSWRPDSQPRAVIAMCHGFNSHSGYYRWAAEQFMSNGCAAYALDLRGRGQSDGRRFYVDDIGDYVSDVSAVVKLARSRDPGLPVFLLGHSAGGIVCCVYTLENQSQLAGLICESFAFRAPGPRFMLTLVKGLSRITPHMGVLRLRNEDFSRDQEVVRSMNDDPLIVHENQPAKTVAALVRADERLEKEFPLITLPVFILHGTADHVTMPSGSQFFYDTVGSKDKTLRLYEGHYHDLLSDTGKEEVITDITGGIVKHLAPEQERERVQAAYTFQGASV